jgi:rhodanese-related sulfurtransferase
LVGTLPDPESLTPDEVADRVRDGAWLIDARPIHDWALAHPVGAISNELRPAFASWLGWIVPFGAPIILIVDDHDRSEAVRLARRIGYDNVALLAGGIDAWRHAGLPTASVEEVDAADAHARLAKRAVLLDVRQDNEVDTLRIPGAEHVELGALIAGATPSGSEVVAFCGHGERSATAISLLEQRGVRGANLVGGIEAWVTAGLPVDS